MHEDQNRAVALLLAYGDGGRGHLDLDGYASIGSNVFGAAVPMAVVVGIITGAGFDRPEQPSAARGQQSPVAPATP